MKLINPNSAGYDGLTHRVIHYCASYICKPLAKVIHSSLSEGLFPRELKQPVILPIFKNGTSKLPEIGVQLIIFRQFLRFCSVYSFARRLLKFLLKYNFISERQFGFAKVRSATDARQTLPLTQSLLRTHTSVERLASVRPSVAYL